MRWPRAKLDLACLSIFIPPPPAHLGILVWDFGQCYVVPSSSLDDHDQRRSARLVTSSKYFPIRRSTRLPLEIPLRVISLDPQAPFKEDCITASVSAHGCGVISPRKLITATRVQLELVADKQTTTGRVLEVLPLDEQNTSWLLGLELERPGNFWGLKYAPADWGEEQPAKMASAVDSGRTSAAATADPRVESSALDRFPAQPSRSNKEIPAALMRRLLSECRLAAISVGACYVQTLTTFPLLAPVKVTIQALGREHPFHGSVRIEHVGAGMGIEFSGSGDVHRERVTKLIEALGTQEVRVPEVRVELAAPDKYNPPKPKSLLATAASQDSLLALILSGGSLKRSDFLKELEAQRQG